MPLNTLRLNQRQLHPNDRITFIKALPGPTKQVAGAFLKKVAAICYPIMKAHSLSITTLEEFPPNREFMGRNFNGGEVIQLVLRRMPARRGGGVSTTGREGRIDPHASDFVSETDDGGWLSLRAVQMVMMHELAHCKQMNHSKAFWVVRDDYATHLRVLWSKGYSGEGMWGRGQGLASGEFEAGGATGAGDFDDLCGGAYRGRGRKRRRREKVSYAERKQRRLQRTETRFGKGHDVGDSEAAKLMLEGKFVAAKPKVANSKRGRELRAAAALARFEQAKVESTREKEEDAADGSEDDETTVSGSETESDLDLDPGDDLVDAKGQHITDAQGNNLYRVREHDDAADTSKKRDELEELIDLTDGSRISGTADASKSSSSAKSNASPSSSTITRGPGTASSDPKPGKPAKAASRAPPAAVVGTKTEAKQISCPICTLLNPVTSKACEACGHVLAPLGHSAKGEDDGGGWTCDTVSCVALGYANPEDATWCGLCGAARG